MQFKNIEVIKTVYFNDEDDFDYRATSKDNVERRYGESWEPEYDLELPQKILKLLLLSKKEYTNGG